MPSTAEGRAVAEAMGGTGPGGRVRRLRSAAYVYYREAA
jgi:hypothetical protein